MTEEQFESLKTDFIENIKSYVVEFGSIFPHISIFAMEKEPKKDADKVKPALIHIPIPDELMVDEEGKETFVNEIFPEIAKQVKKTYDSKALAWTSEAWIRTAKKPEQLNNWQEMPIEKEVIVITLEFENRNEFTMYEIKRHGKQITSEGDMVDKIELIECEFSSQPEKIQGRFAGLFAKLKD